MKYLVVFFLTFFISIPALADDCVPPPGGKCLTKPQMDSIKEALTELQSIHDSPAEVLVQEPIIIIHDWEERVYVNGGDQKPLRMKLTIGKTIDRDLATTLPVQVYFRPKPPDPMFRLRIRAQAGILVPQLVNSASGDAQRFWDIWASFDFFHIDLFNVAVNAGVQSTSFGLGMDLTKNFGVTGGYALIYDGLKSSVFSGVYFSF